MKKRIKFFFKTLTGIILLMKVETSFSQVLPLFYNGDFENRSSCPSNFGQVGLVNGLSNCTESVDYFNTCGFKTNLCRTVTPFSGNGCIGMWGAPWNATGTQYESAVAVLDNPTVNGAQYDINFYLFGENNAFSPCNSPAPGSCFSFGFKFFKSSNPLTCNTGLFPIPPGTHPTPDVSIDGSAVITGSWNNYSLLYTANDVYDRVLFGWFPNASAYTSTCYNTDPKAYAYMDKLCMDAPGNNCAVCNYSVDAVTSNTTICAGNSISLSGTAGGGVTTTSWTTSGNGSFSSTTALNTTYTPTSNDIAAGTVTLTITTDDPAGSCAAKTDKVIVTISSQANTSINSAGPFCANASSSTLTAAQSGGVWSGTGITNTSAGVFNPGIAGVGNHVITYSISGSCGSSSTTTIQVIANTIATITPVGSLCSSSSSVNLTASQTGGVWSGTGITNSVNGVFSPTTAGVGSHVVTYSISGTCGGSSTTTIQVTNKANASINSAGPFCTSNSPLNLTAAQTGGVWSGAGITNSVNGTFSPNTAGAGTHTITYMINGSCGDTATVNVQVITDANTTINFAGPFCSNSNSVNLIAAQAGGVWNGTGITNSVNGTFSPNTAGAGNHVVTYSISGTCGGSSTTTIQVTNKANATINSAGPFCASSSSLNLTAAQTGGVWSGTGITNSVNGTFSPNTAGAGTHTITYMINGNCGDIATVNVQVINDANTTINPAGPFCSNSNTVNLTAAQTGGVWIGMGINSSTGVFDPSSVVLGNNVITYSISGTCGSSSTTTIQVNESDTASFSYADTKFCIPTLDPSPIILKTQGGVFSIDNGGVIDAQTGKISLEASGVGSYSVTYQTMGTAGCPDQSSVLITICGESSVSIPNVFSPNGDNVNDHFHIKGVNIKSIKTEIFNRWGTQVYSWDGIDGYWDGKTASGDMAAPGTYFYVTTIVDITDQTTTKNGFLTLVK